MGTASSVYRVLKLVVVKLVEPLKTDDSVKQFTLSIPEAQTTTVDSVQGWQNRPPAVLQCPGCESEMLQHNAMGTIDCSECWREFREDEFSDHELLEMVCPRCDSVMEHGIRHPKMFDIPEWATCPSCQYHWDLDHWFSR